jgi:hypothetical protein
MTKQLNFPQRQRIVAKRPTFAQFQDTKLRAELRNTIRSEAVKNTIRMEHDRLKNALSRLSPAMREAANRRMGELENILR